MTVQGIDNKAEAAEPAVSGSRRRGKLLRRLCFVAVPVLLTPLLMEAMLRVYVAARGWTPNCYAANLDLLRPHPVNGYDLKPGFELRSGVFHITTNSLGLRGPETSPQKPPGVVRVAILGGSSVFGYLVSDGDEDARRLQRKLNADGCRVEVINAGVPGYNLFESLVRYREVIAPLKPDVVVFYGGYNDMGYLCSDEPDAARWRAEPIPPRWERWAGRSTLYGFVAYRLIQRGFNPGVGALITTTPTPAGIRQFQENLAALADAASESGAKFVICAQVGAASRNADPHLHRHLGDTDEEIDRAIAIFGRMQEELRSFAEERNIPFVDASAQIQPTDELVGDSIHLTAAGEEQIASLLQARLEPLLPNCVGSDRERAP